MNIRRGTKPLRSESLEDAAVSLHTGADPSEALERPEENEGAASLAEDHVEQSRSWTESMVT
jgi:hypothetical protein